MTISLFRGEYSFLSNFYSCDLEFNGILYHSSENAYQAQKASWDSEIEIDNKKINTRRYISTLSASESKKFARTIKLDSNFESDKVLIMRDVVYSKFKQNPYLAKKLLDTKNELLVEGNWWHDTFWGVCNGVGENYLGRILMEVRTILGG